MSHHRSSPRPSSMGRRRVVSDDDQDVRQALDLGWGEGVAEGWDEWVEEWDQ